MSGFLNKVVSLNKGMDPDINLKKDEIDRKVRKVHLIFSKEFDDLFYDHTKEDDDNRNDHENLIRKQIR
jgi:hypothetical protein